MSSRAVVRGLRRPERKVQLNFPPKSPAAVPPWRLGGLAKTGPLSSRSLGWSAIEERIARVRVWPASFLAFCLLPE